MDVSSLLTGLAGFTRRHAAVTLLAALAAMLLALAFSSRHLALDSETDRMFAADLAWRRHQAEFERAFPQFSNLLLLVIDRGSPETMDAVAEGLASALGAGAPGIAEARRPDADPFLRRAGLLFLDTARLEALLERTIDAQPFLGQLAADPSARGLFAALALLGLGVRQENVDLKPYEAALGAFHDTIAAGLAGREEPLSWMRLLGAELADLAGTYRFVTVRVRPDFGLLSPGAAASQAVRAAIAARPEVAAGQVRVRVTGPVALADEEFATVADGAVEGMIGSFMLVLVLLVLALRGWRLVLPVVFTLLTGLSLTLLFASLAVGTLNLVSVGFGVLFIGLAVDFAIQFAVGYRAARHETADGGGAILLAARRSGGPILLAAVTTAAGFLAFVPTAFSGVGELGLIAGAGMLIAFVCTMALMPAGIALCRPPAEARAVGLAWAGALDRAIRRGRVAVVAACAVLAAGGIAALPRIGFDADPLNTKDGNTEAMRTLRELIANPLTNPYSIEILAPSVDAAGALAKRLAALRSVEEVLTLDSLVPADQAAKRALIADAAAILGPSLAPRAPAAAVTAAEIRMAARTARGALEKASARLPAGHPVALLAADMAALEGADEARLGAVDRALTRHLPAMIARLGESLAPPAVTRADIPPGLARDWVAPDGRARVQVIARPEGRDSDGMRAFVAEVTALAPEATGAAAVVTATAETIVGAFRAAFLWALGAIALILVLVLRRALDVALVLAPLCLAALLTALVIVMAGIDLNYANIIALPLLLGVGVSFNIYFVRNWRAGLPHGLDAPVARAVVFSALTTAAAFGALALSAHPGTASMGVLLLINLGAALVASLVFLPALLALLPPPR